MGLYVSVCLLAALVALGESASHGHVRVLGIVWGTTMGLALAHLFAFRLSSRLVGSGSLTSDDRLLGVAQLAGATAVAILATIPVVLLPATVETDVTRLLLAGFIAVVGYSVARSSGAGTVRSLLYGTSILVVGLTVAIVKNVLSGH